MVFKVEIGQLHGAWTSPTDLSLHGFKDGRIQGDPLY